MIKLLIGGAMGATLAFMYLRKNCKSAEQLEKRVGEIRDRTAKLFQDYGWPAKDGEEIAEQLTGENTPKKDA